jgi:hypothetical protein
VHVAAAASRRHAAPVAKQAARVARVALPPVARDALVVAAPLRAPTTNGGSFALPALVRLAPAQAPAISAARTIRSAGSPITPGGRALGGTGASGAPAPGPGVGLVVAVLLSLLLLVAPRAGRRLRLDVALARPPLFVSLLERPG